MFGKQRHVFVYNKTRETFIAFKVKVADSILGRLVGLLGKRSLQPDSGVWICPANAVHTKIGDADSDGRSRLGLSW